MLLWSFDNSLHAKLELETSREITSISFCPYDENLILGGTINGQLLIWDLTNRLKKAETEEFLSPAQQRYRTSMRAFLAWTKQDNQDRIVRPAAISALQTSHKAAITGIKWLNQKYYVASTGNIKENPSGSYRYVVTTSVDCSIAFWNMDYVDEAEARRIGAGGTRKLKLPDHLMSETSDYERLNRVFRPEYMLVYNRPVVDSFLDCGSYEYETVDVPLVRHLQTRVAHTITEVPLDSFNERIVAGTFMGTLANLTWAGSDRNTDIIKKEIISKPDLYAQLHDGPVLIVERNPFLPDLFASVGRNILVLWTADTMWTPLLWRRSSAQLTSLVWSLDRPSVFYTNKTDGTFSAWDLLSRTDEPCLVESMGGMPLSYLLQHKLSLPQSAVLVADYNSSARLLLIPPVLKNPKENEKEVNLFKHA